MVLLGHWLEVRKLRLFLLDSCRHFQQTNGAERYASGRHDAASATPPAVLRAERGGFPGSRAEGAAAPGRGSGRRRRRFTRRPAGAARDAGLRLSLPF
jgi:hypothetical protein